MAVSAGVREVRAFGGAHSVVRTNQVSDAFVRLSHLHKLRECEQVAAVCYRVRNECIEFLLVQTRGGGRWTFPKGSAEAGLTHAQAAALEAFEEAGVHGRMEEASFARYLCRKRGVARKSASRSPEDGISVNAHLCQVMRLSTPRESNRNRTWFSVTDAKRSLQEGREKQEAAEFTRVVEKAIARIKRSVGGDRVVANQSAQNGTRDALQKVQMEGVLEPAIAGRATSFVSYTRGRLCDPPGSSPTNINAEHQPLQGEVLQFSPAQAVARSADCFPGRKKPKALGPGAKNS